MTVVTCKLRLQFRVSLGNTETIWLELNQDKGIFHVSTFVTIFEQDIHSHNIHYRETFRYVYSVETVNETGKIQYL